MKKQILFFEIIPSYIIVLMPALLITGPFLSDLGVSIVAILFLINSKKNDLLKYYNNIYFKFFIIFWIILIISSLLSNNILISLKNSFFYFRFGIFSLCFWFLIEKNAKILHYLFYSIIICFISLIIDGYIQYFFKENLFGFKLHGGNRVSSFFGSELILGSYLARFFPILFGLFVFIDHKLKIKNKKLLVILTLTFILSEGLIVLSGERVALFFMNSSAIFIILMINDYKKYRFWTYVGSLLLIFGLIFFFPKTQDRIIKQTIDGFTSINSKNADTNNIKEFYIFTKTHNDMYIAGLQVFNNNKFFGVGPRQYRNKCKDYDESVKVEIEESSRYHPDKKDYLLTKLFCQTHPHNTYIELLSETGIFGFTLVFGTFLLIIFFSMMQFFNNIFNKKKKYFNDFELCLLSAMIISLWPLAPTGSFFNNWMSIVYYFPIGIFLWSRNSSNKSN
jgi:O-antigen ligase